MTAPRKPVAWLCVSEDGFAADAAISESQRDTYARMRRAIHPLYLETDLQPLWALVEKWEKRADEAEAKELQFAQTGDQNGADCWGEYAATKRQDARELKGTLEAMQ